MYYSDVSDSLVVRRSEGVWGCTLKVRGPVMLFLPVLSVPTSCAAWSSPKSSSAGVSDLSPGLRRMSVSPRDSLAGATHKISKAFIF